MLFDVGMSFDDTLRIIKKRVYEYLRMPEYGSRFGPADINTGVYSYMSMGGKSLRPAVLLFSCGAVGGDIHRALPAAAAVEVFHTWTLVHDDIIDRDGKRRGDPTVHERFRSKALEDYGYDDAEARHYGLSVGILAGDLQQGWSTSLLCELYHKQGVNPAAVLHIIRDLASNVQSTLIEGEMLDIIYSKRPIASLNENLIIDMLWKKTGVLYEFAGRAGAMIGLGTEDVSHGLVQSLSAFASQCGTAFQLQDDILGVVGDEQLLGKPVGSDIREGKRTTIVQYALEQATAAQKAELLGILGNEQASGKEIGRVVDLLRDLGGVQRTQRLAKSYIEKALGHLKGIPESMYKDLLCAWADFMINRQF
jgi:geranylgeranyl diphosphate synthase, type I